MIYLSILFILQVYKNALKFFMLKPMSVPSGMFTTVIFFVLCS